MKVSIIGAGNMGGAVARGLTEAVDKYEVRVSNPSAGKLDAIKTAFPNVLTSQSNYECAQGAEVIILGVKPWKVKEVIDELKPIWSSQDSNSKSILVSMAAGIDIADLRAMAGEGIAIYKAIPNTAVSLKCGVTFISRETPDEQSDRIVSDIFSALGLSEIVEERMLDAGMAVASCGMAFMMRMLRAMTEGGVELGLYASTALRAAAATMRGAAELIDKNGLHPEQEVDKVTTPGGLTIRGINAMEEAGFTGAVVKGLRACVKVK
ncbi:MAG: pyrroline-5-carboxylate reductase [Muribaculaceae bacterium]|nr:pyrroline-5-carboxylate reductase [Muribaculaceae bacterium]